MCGIAGWVLRSEPERGADGEARHDTLAAMSAALAHRGPDDEGFHRVVTRDGAWSVALAHRRLSILDLDGGHQPMSDASGLVTIVFNGEVYNFAALRRELEAAGHAFRTRSDTEVILAAYREWGERCVERLHGMFAFALWDAERERLVLARDRFGKKPLFIAAIRDGLAFASEIKALLRLPELEPRVDLGAVHDYLAYRYVPEPRTMLLGVRKLPAASAAVWERGALRERRWYTPPDRAPWRAGAAADSEASAVERFLTALDDAVSTRMVCDVPFGAFLSGGIDSSTVVALMTRHSTHAVKTFSVGFADGRYSELDDAREVATLFGTDHHELEVSDRDMIELLPQLVRARDAPVSEPSDIPIYLLALEARRSVKMVLTGEGSDEFLGGYPKHIFERWIGAYHSVPRVVRGRLIEPLARALPYRFRRAKTAVATMGIEDARERLPRWFGALSSAERRRLIRSELEKSGSGASDAAADVPPFDVFPESSALRRILYFDQTSWLPDNLLERGDRMTMAASLEARMPFMDHELAELVSSLPDRYRVRGRQTKWILRRAAERLLPRRILERPKVGFRVPVNEWFRTSMADTVRDALLGGSSLTAAYFDRRALESTIDAHVRGRQNHEKLLWTLLNLEIWHREVLAPSARTAMGAARPRSPSPSPAQHPS